MEWEAIFYYKLQSKTHGAPVQVIEILQLCGGLLHCNPNWSATTHTGIGLDDDEIGSGYVQCVAPTRRTFGEKAQPWKLLRKHVGLTQFIIQEIYTTFRKTNKIDKETPSTVIILSSFS